jgi:hypothetical protein
MVGNLGPPCDPGELQMRADEAHAQGISSGRVRPCCREVRLSAAPRAGRCRGVVSDNRYGWVAFCEKQFGEVPSQICFEWNTPQHTTGDAVPPRRRAFTKTELHHMFDVVDDFVDEAHRTGSQRWLTALRDSTAFKICYAYGLRRRELVMLDLADFVPNPHVVRLGSSPSGSGVRSGRIS